SLEEKVLRGFMLDARTVAKFRTRRPKERPKTVTLQIKRGNQFESVDLPASEATGILQLPTLSPPSFFTGLSVPGVAVTGMETIGFGQPPEDLAARLNTKELRSTVNIDVRSFARMIAKIGYSFAVSQIGTYPLDEVPVVAFILGEESDGSRWVGSNK